MRARLGFCLTAGLRGFFFGGFTSAIACADIIKVWTRQNAPGSDRDVGEVETQDHCKATKRRTVSLMGSPNSVDFADA